ncbi:cell division protein ZapE [Paraglaciecola sp. L1A13]|uniref:cell division protein ZapE n=1 Tax=Paraglaciecola sp. L1A13 TaxID=2686359 RepID=UPI00131B5CBF|nr:cell division protein ZapE [Paraglaciecola sp. L1A13]|tara:strand:- start:6340 stop:7446 length:1107 start_codon:yes stop_codon:yes gene_type:complete
MSALTPWQKYQLDLQREDFHSDPAQANAVKQLQRLYDELVEPHREPSLWTKIKFVIGKDAQTSAIKGLYFWGGVGRGKTYLVDTFYDCLPFEKKMRVHFHRFMHRVHEELKGLAGQSDPLKTIAAKFASEANVICFDEFFVSDITDAMILGTLMEEMFARGIVLVATSNIIPDELYRNGLQRARFLPAIALINQNTQVINVDSGVDYRLRTLQQAEIYHYPLGPVATDNLAVYFNQLASDECHHDGAIIIKGRPIPAIHYAQGVAMFEFRALCDGPRSQTDYMELSRCYHSILLANVEQMGLVIDDIARRFIAMVDEFYERNVKLIMSAEVPLEELYTQGSLNFEFRRCLSRLKEMQSHDYLATEHLP